MKKQELKISVRLSPGEQRVYVKVNDGNKVSGYFSGNVYAPSAMVDQALTWAIRAALNHGLIPGATVDIQGMDDVSMWVRETWPTTLPASKARRRK